jgi:DNA adenine methylase
MYYKIRESFSAKTRPSCRLAAEFIYLNRFCFNGLFRTNLSGHFNVPYAPAGTGDLPSFDELQGISRVLNRATIVHSDFEAVIRSTTVGDFIYADPPYAVENRRVFRQYSPTTFGRHDLERLSEALIRADKRGVKFVLSYAHCKEAFEYFGMWPSKRIYVTRNISGFAMHRRKAGELIFSNCSSK